MANIRLTVDPNGSAYSFFVAYSSLTVARVCVLQGLTESASSNRRFTDAGIKCKPSVSQLQAIGKLPKTVS